MIALGYRVVLLITGCLGLVVARRFARYRPIPVVLLALFAVDLARELTPRMDLVAPRLGLHLEQALALAFPVTSAWLALRILAGHGTAVPLVIGATALAALVLGYPEMRGGAALMIFGGVHFLAAGAEVGAAGVAWFGHRTHYLPERAALLLVAGDAAGLVGPWIGSPERFWDLGVLQGIAALLVLCYVQIRWICALRPAGAR